MPVRALVPQEEMSTSAFLFLLSKSLLTACCDKCAVQITAQHSVMADFIMFLRAILLPLAISDCLLALMVGAHFGLV
jgi:hypothetical protein